MPPETDSNAPELSPFEQLRAATPDFPNDARLASWKSTAPGGRIKLFCPDGKRVFFLRAVSGMELSKIQSEIIANAKNPDYEVQVATVTLCTLWCNVGDAQHRIDDGMLRTGPAGLPESLWAVIQNLSDFYEPVQLYNFSMEL
jgi:hypothetical protein